MFYVQWMAGITVMFWVSAVLAESVFDSVEERNLPVGTRVGLAFFFSLAWFAAASVLVSIQIAWLMSATLFLLHMACRRGERLRRFLEFRNWMPRYWMSYVSFVLLTNLFLLPLHISRVYGPFTEGGGDVSVYADVAKYFTDQRLPVYGLDDIFNDVRRFIGNPMGGRLEHRSDIQAIDPHSANPPQADYQCNRFLLTKSFPSIQFSPTAQWAFLSAQTNHAVFFANLSVLYALTIISFWDFFRPFGKTPALIAGALVATSHGLISVFYNMYFLQALSIAATAILLSISPRISLFSRAGVRSFGVLMAVVLVGYAHFMVVIFPLVLLSAWMTPRRWLHRGAATRDNSLSPVVGSDRPIRSRPIAPKWSSWQERLWTFTQAAGGQVVVLVMLCWVMTGTMASIAMYFPILSGLLDRFTGSSAQASTPLMGSAVPPWSWEWGSFLFGALSQQHYQPLSNPIPLSLIGARLSVCLGAALALSGLLLWTILLRFRSHGTDLTEVSPSRLTDPGAHDVRSLALFSAVSVVAVGTQLAIAQGNLYTQAKGAQNVLILLYAALLLPFCAALLPANSHSRPIQRARRCHAIFLIAFCVSLALPRLLLVLSLSFGLDRSGILEPSYFKEAARIRGEDPDAIVLMESRKSADIYLAAQPFHGSAMLPTRHLALTQISVRPGRPPGDEVLVDHQRLASDYFSERDLPHLWLLSASEGKTSSFMGRIRYYPVCWKSQRLESNSTGKLILFGHDYEAFFKLENRLEGNGEKGWFSYVRNGAGVLLVPSGPRHQLVEVLVKPRHPTQMKTMIAQLCEQPDSTLWDSPDETHVITDGALFVYTFDTVKQGRLLKLPRYWDEYWLNVRINNLELHPD
ncbi:MAG: hypothetical protein AB1898_06280 [Acidobacteriota bacterium]